MRSLFFSFSFTGIWKKLLLVSLIDIILKKKPNGCSTFYQNMKLQHKGNSRDLTAIRDKKNKHNIDSKSMDIKISNDLRFWSIFFVSGTERTSIPINYEGNEYDWNMDISSEKIMISSYMKSFAYHGYLTHGHKNQSDKIYSHL